MNSNPKREAALKLLEASGIRQSNYAPTGLLFLWRLGFDCPPPHLASFGSIFLVSGLYFGITMGLLMSIYYALMGNFVISHVAVGATVAGLLFGLFMAITYAIGRKKYKLPLWKDVSA